MENIQDILDIKDIISRNLKKEILFMNFESIQRIEPIVHYIVRKTLNKYSINFLDDAKQLFIGFADSQVLGGSAEIYGYQVELHGSEKAILFFQIDYKINVEQNNIEFFDLLLKEVKTFSDIEKEAKNILSNILSGENQTIALSRLFYFDKYC